MATFWVDDGATSSWLGPLLVGAQRRRDGKIEVARIDPDLLRAPNRWELLVSAYTLAVLSSLGARAGDRVMLCRGNLFNRAAADLRACVLQVERGVITGELQAELHREGRRCLRDLMGNVLASSREQLAWVAADPDHRLCHMRARYRDRLTLTMVETAATAECVVAGV